MPKRDEGITDLHSHLVPGVDDGSQTLEESLEGVGRLWEAGVRRIVTTPHFMGSLSDDLAAKAARMEEMDHGWATLKEGVDRAFPELELRRGFEVMVDIPNPDLSDPNLRLGGTGYVLVEWPHLKVPPGTLGVLTRLQESGIRPIIAHPERYTGFDPELALAGRWRELGIRLQLNYGSLLGRYGEAPRSRALLLLERGWVDLLSTDFHGRPHLPLSLAQAREVFTQLEAEDHFHILARVNPAKILSDEEPVPVPPILRKRDWRDKLREIFRGRVRG
jgi:protein-tyrosine phosphatase